MKEEIYKITCADCVNKNRCMERSRNYCCTDFKRNLSGRGIKSDRTYQVPCLRTPELPDHRQPVLQRRVLPEAKRVPVLRRAVEYDGSPL